MHTPQNPFYKAIGSKITSARTAAGLTQQQLAEKIGLSRAAVANIEKGRQNILVHVLYDLVNALELKPMDLLPESWSRESPTSHLPSADILDAIKKQFGTKAADQIINALNQAPTGSPHERLHSQGRGKRAAKTAL